MMNNTQRNALEKLATELFGECISTDFLHFQFSTFGNLRFNPAKLPVDWYMLHIKLKHDEKSDIFYPPNAEEKTAQQFEALKITNEQAAKFFKEWTNPKHRNENPSNSSKIEFEVDLRLTSGDSLDEDEIQDALLESLIGLTIAHAHGGGGAPPQDVLDMEQSAVDLRLTSGDSLDEDEMRDALLESLMDQTIAHAHRGGGAPPQDVLDMEQSAWQTPSKEQLDAMGLTLEEFAAMQ